MNPQWDPTYSLVGGIAAALGITLTTDVTHLSVAVVAAMIGASAWLVTNESEMGRIRAVALRRRRRRDRHRRCARVDQHRAGRRGRC